MADVKLQLARQLMRTADGKSAVDPSAIDCVVETTWSDLKVLRDGGTLAMGVWYRITDYQCTTLTKGTTSAGHQFDIIVRADSPSILNENAYACLHDGDTYFANNDLSAWRLKYCIDNDSTHYNWADATNGKGVIYWMKDEFDNECPYDFKNIQYYRSYDNSTGLFSILNTSAEGIPCYTFSNELTSESTEAIDYSLDISKLVYGNTINAYFHGTKYFCLSKINFFGRMCYCNKIGDNCSSLTFADLCHNNTFDSYCLRNILKKSCWNNKFGYGCQYNTLEAYSYLNEYKYDVKYTYIHPTTSSAQVKYLIVYPSVSGSSNTDINDISIPDEDINTNSPIIYE